MDRVFLDANLLFSAAWRSSARIRRLWELRDVRILASFGVADEARVNLREKKPEALAELDQLLAGVEIPAWDFFVQLPGDMGLREKDRHVLQAAIGMRASHLLTGDVRDFGPFLGRRVAGVLILRERDYFMRRGLL